MLVMTRGTGRPVFISYARQTAGAHAKALAEVLGDRAFLDVADAPDGEAFPEMLAEAVLAAFVVVIFADAAYFHSSFCRAERLLALSPRAAPDWEPSHVVIALGPDADQEVLHNLQRSLRNRSWPRFDETARIAALVEKRLGEIQRSIRDTDPERTARVRKQVLEGLILPLPLPPGDIVAAPLPLPRSIHDRFVGREEVMEDLHQALWHGGTAALTGALRGAAGFGKTRVAIEYFRRYGPLYYTGGLFWLNAEGEVARQFHSMISAIRRAEGRHTPSLDEFAQIALAAKQEMEDVLAVELGAELRKLAARAAANQRRVLFVADNVPETKLASPPASLSRWCPALDEVSVLVTSRATVPEVDWQRSFKVSALKESAAVELLTRDLSDQALHELKPEGWRTIANWVGCHARVLETLNATLVYGGKRPRDLLVLAQGGDSLAEIRKQEEALRTLVPAESVRGITEALRSSFDALPKASQRAGRRLAFLGPDPIPESILKKLVAREEEMEVRMTLRLHSWVEEGEESEGDGEIFGSMHRLLAEFLRSMSDDPPQELGEVVAALNDVFTVEACEDARRWKELNPFQAHVEHVVDRALMNATDERIFAIVSLCLALGTLRREQGQAAAARRSEERALDLAKAKLGVENRLTLTAKDRLARSLWVLGDLDGARQLQEEALIGRRHILGLEDRDTLTSMSELGVTLWRQGHFLDARKLQEETLERQRRVLGTEDPHTLTSMNNLAETLIDCDDLPCARRLHEEVLTVRSRVLGEEDPKTLISMNNLGETLRAKGDLVEARRVHGKALVGRRHVLGEEHPDTTLSARNLFSTLHDMGDREAAQAILDKHLVWLLRRDPATLGAQQRAIQRFLLSLPAQGYRIE